MLRHRAVLLGIVGALLLYAAFDPGTRSVAFWAGMVSMVSYLVITLLTGTDNAALLRIAWVDVAAVAVLVGGYLAHLQQQSAS